MGKVIKQQATQYAPYKRGISGHGKLPEKAFYGKAVVPLNPRLKALLAKARETSLPTRYIVVQVDEQLAGISAQRQPIAKVEAAKRLFAKYNSSK